ncbi:MAG: hypothetical protein JWQ96_2197 [Segetibacter sp.]|nr:hypothetical protein [Segetibacter sp.]
MYFKKNKQFFILATLIWFGSFNSISVFGQSTGCRDPYANNYNAQASINDGSCTYNVTTYTPPVQVDSISPVLLETSGLQMAGDFLWSFNDGGGQAAIYRIDTITNTILQTVTLTGATNVDWEALEFDGTHFYVGDFGNNANGARTDLKIYKFPFSAIPNYTTNPNSTIPLAQIEVINFIYSDQVQPPVPLTANNTKFDCEAMFVDAGKIHLFTKNWVEVNTTHYILPSTLAGTYTAIPSETLSTNYLVTDADKVADQSVVALLGYQNSGTANHFIHFLSDFSAGLYFNGNKRRIDLPDAITMGQAEGITYRNSTYGYISNEKFTRTVGSFTITVNQKLRSFNTNNFVSPSVLPLDLRQFNVVNNQGTHKISWTFDSKVDNVELQVSNNGVNFNSLMTYNNSITDAFIVKPTSPVNCYRLLWQKNGGATHYSNNVCISAEIKNAVSKLLLRANGELSFVLDGNQPEYYAFKLISTDGKLLAETQGRTYNPGLNRIRFSNNAIVNSVVFLTAVSNGEQQTKLLPVNK